MKEKFRRERIFIIIGLVLWAVDSFSCVDLILLCFRFIFCGVDFTVEVNYEDKHYFNILYGTYF